MRRRIRVHKVDSDSNDKLQTLTTLLANISGTDGGERSIVFVNHRESAERTAAFLRKHGVPAVLYHGALDQRDRETAVALFNNGTRPVLVATDLAARGLDIEGVRNVIHYHMPLTEETYTHRNGRTARVDKEGDIYVLVGPEEDVKPYIAFDTTFYPDPDKEIRRTDVYDTLAFSAGRREKLSKGDILGFLVKEGEVSPSDIGKIEIFDHYSLAAVRADDVNALLNRIRTKKIKGSKRMISLVG